VTPPIFFFGVFKFRNLSRPRINDYIELAKFLFPQFGKNGCDTFFLSKILSNILPSLSHDACEYETMSSRASVPVVRFKIEFVGWLMG